VLPILLKSSIQVSRVQERGQPLVREVRFVLLAFFLISSSNGLPIGFSGPAFVRGMVSGKSKR
jgi:hypothetical protein